MPLSLLFQFLFSLEAVLSFRQHFLRSFDSLAHPCIILHTLDWSNLLAEGKKQQQVSTILLSVFTTLISYFLGCLSFNADNIYMQYF